MNLHVLFSAPLAIQIHVYAAVLAAIIGVAVLWRRKGTTTHKRWGKVWVGLMAVTASTSLFIHEIQLVGLFSPIHLISLWVLYTLYTGVQQAKSGSIVKHQKTMKSTFIGGIGVAGLFTLLPSRMMYEVAIAPAIETNPWALTVLPVVVVVMALVLLSYRLR
jgi:uncharacterized membrane protein